MKVLNFLVSRDEINKDTGLLVVRVVIGISIMVFHGFSKIKGGSELWTDLGREVSVLGINFLPVFWGFMAGFAEFFCSFLLILGVLFQGSYNSSCMYYDCSDFGAFKYAPGKSCGWLEWCFPCIGVVSTVYIGLFFTGPGRYKL